MVVRRAEDRAVRATIGPALVARGLALKPAMSVRALLSAAAEVEDALDVGDLDRARARLSWHLVSPNTSNLSSSEVAAAAIESLSENLNGALGVRIHGRRTPFRPSVRCVHRARKSAHD